MLASLGLKLRELGRRNREGDLSVPGFWPVALAPLFWPLLLGLLLALLLVATLRFRQAPAAPSVSEAEPPPVQRPRPAEVFRTADAVPQGDPPLPPGPPAAEPSLPPPPLQLDPLLALLAETDPQGCIAAARPDPRLHRLDLELTAAWWTLPQPRRQQLADGWLRRSRDLGYEQLRLLDAAEAPLGSAARVGDGMVLLDGPLAQAMIPPQPPSP